MGGKWAPRRGAQLVSAVADHLSTASGSSQALVSHDPPPPPPTLALQVNQWPQRTSVSISKRTW